MRDYRRLLLVAILAWSASAVAVHAENEDSGAPCNALCRFWLGHGDRSKEPQPAPVVAAQAPPPAVAVPQDPESETPPIVRMKRKAAFRTRRPASPPPASLPSDVPVDEEQSGAQGAVATAPPPTASALQPMELVPDEAVAPAEPAPEVRPPPIPPHRPMLQSRQARLRRPARPSKDEPSVALSATHQGSRQPAGPVSALSKLSKPAMAPAASAARPSVVAVTAPRSPARPPVDDASDLLGTLPPSSAPSIVALPGVPTPAPAALSSLDAGSTSVGRTTPAIETAHLHDVAPGPRPALTADSTATVPVAAKRQDTNPDEVLETLKETILRSAQEALKQSEGHGF